jgi:DNA-dependent RNA polymerase
MAFLGKRNLPFIWKTPSGMEISFALGKVKSQRAGLNFLREGSGVRINIINKDEIDVKKSVVALMPNFIHSLDAASVHEITELLHKLKIEEIKKEVQKKQKEMRQEHFGYMVRMGKEEQKRIEEEYLINNYTYDSNKSFNEDKTLFDINFFDKEIDDFIEMAAFKKNIPLYTIHDCFATTPYNMGLMKENITLLFSKMYFSTPYIETLHISLLKQILKHENIFGYPLEFITEEKSSNDKNDKLIIKDFKKVNVIPEKIIKINLNYLDEPTNKQDIFNNKYYLFTEDINKNKNKNLIPLFPPMIYENIKKNRDILYRSAPDSVYLIS